MSIVQVTPSITDPPVMTTHPNTIGLSPPTFKTTRTCPVVTQDLPVPTARKGVADIIGFGQDGVYILRNNFQSALNIKNSAVIKGFGHQAGGWLIDQHVRLVGDTTGDGNADIIGFGNEGVWIARNNGNNTFGPITLRVQQFGYVTGGWHIEKHLRYVADLRNTGRVDIIGFSDAGVVVALNHGDGTFGPLQMVLHDLGYNAGGWRKEKHLRLLGDVTGNGLPDIVAFGEQCVSVALNNGDGTFKPLYRAVSEGSFAYQIQGWRIESHPRMLADLTGDGRVDIVGFANAGVNVSYNNGDGTFQDPKNALPSFGSTAGGWRVEKHPRFIADLTGDGRGDIVGFADDGVYVSLNNGDGTFPPPKLVLASFGYIAGGWRVEKHPRFLVDLTGNGCADIIGFGDAGVFVSYNDGQGNFSAIHKLSDSFGSSDAQWPPDTTIRFVANLYD